VRFYNSEIAKILWAEVPNNSIVPNIHISIASRRLRLNIHNVNIFTRDRIDTEKLGSTWQEKRKRHQSIPPRKFIVFCWKAIREIYGLLF